MQVVVHRRGNILIVSTPTGPETPREIVELIRGDLEYDHKRHVRGRNRVVIDGHSRRVEVTRTRLYGYTHDRAMSIPAGFARTIHNRLVHAGHQVLWRDYPLEDQQENTYQSDKELVTRFCSYRARQEECVDAILTHRCGIVDAITGFGKMRIIEMVCLALNRATIDIVTKRRTVASSIASLLSKRMPCGLVQAGRPKLAPRVNVYVAASLHKSPATSDVLLIDEVHECVSDRAIEHLQRYQRSRNFGFTASPEGRGDGADLRIEALCGQTIFQLLYPEGVALGLVVPIRVEWRDTDCPVGMFQELEDVALSRHAVWRNVDRNRSVAEAAQQHMAADRQVLILVETLEHAAYLSHQLPDVPLMYATDEDVDIRRYKAQGLLRPDYQPLDNKAREAIKEDFRAGCIPCVIATRMWEVGVDFPGLSVLVRADAAGSDIASIQGPGRVARIHGQKDAGIVVDFRDKFDRRLAARAGRRSRCYASSRLGWEQVDL